MKKLLSALALVAGFANGAIAQDQKKETIEGNGKMETRTLPVQSFDALKVSGVFELKISQGSNESVKIEADENLQQNFTVHNEGSKLVIDMEKMKDKSMNLRSKNKMIVYVTFKKLKNLELNMVGNTSSANELIFDDIDITTKAVGNINLKLTADKITLKNKGVGNVTLSGKAQTADIISSGVGSLEAGDLIVQTMIIEKSGIGSADVNVTKNITVKSRGMGSIKNRGAAPLPRKKKVVEI